MPRTRLVGPTERMIYLRSIPVAAVVPAQVLSVLANAFSEKTFSAGEVVVQQGEPVDALELLVEGKLPLMKSGKRVGQLEPPQSIGFLDILARADSTYDAVAVSDLHTLHIDTDALLEIIEDHFPMMEATLSYFAERLYPEVAGLPAEVLDEFLAEPFESDFEVSSPAKRDDASNIDFVERMLFLRNTRVFASTNLNALGALSRQLVEHRLEPGTTIWQRGDSVDRFLIILSGRARCTAKDGKQFGVGPGALLGAAEGIADKPRWFYMEAEESLVILDGRVDTLLELFEDNSRMGIDFIATLARDLRRAIARKLELGIQTIDVRRQVSNLGAVKVGA